jgi:hypothetical protein
VWNAAGFLMREEVRDCELRYADWVREVDVYECVAGGGGVIFGEGCARWVPEVGPWLL